MALSDLDFRDRIRHFVLFLALVSLPLVANGKASPAVKQVKILVTSDLHGWLSTSLVYPEEKRKGLLHISDEIFRLRREDPDAILLDAGDLLQGSPLVSYIHGYRRDPAEIDPFFKLVQRLNYDAIAVGNHDLGVNPIFEAEYLPKSRFSWLAGNIFTKSGPRFRPYVILNRYGLKIAVLGLTTPGVQMWLSMPQIAGYRFEPVKESAASWLNKLKAVEHPDLVIGLIHSGLYAFRDDENSKLNRLAPANEVMETLQHVDGFDLVVAGHDHRLSPHENSRRVRYVRRTPVVEGGRWGEGIMELTLSLVAQNRGWRVASIQGHLHKPSQDHAIEQRYLRHLPADYLDHLNQPLPYVFGQTTRDQANLCLNLLNSMAQDNNQITGTLLPYLRVDRIRNLPGRRLRRLELYKWLRYDNRAVTVRLCQRDITLIANPEPESGRKRIPGNRKFYARLKTASIPAGEEEGWSLDHGQFKRIHKIKISDYHVNGGGGVLPQLFFQNGQIIEKSTETLRESLFRYLEKTPQLPPACSFFLKPVSQPADRDL